MLLAKEATVQSQEGIIILDVAKIDLVGLISRVQQDCSSLANVSSLGDKGLFLNVGDDKERAGVVGASKSERLEATRRIRPEAIQSQLSTSRNLGIIMYKWPRGNFYPARTCKG